MAPVILFSGGGSLGHIAPSVAVADALRAKDLGVRCVFACADRDEEKTMLTKAGYPFRVLSAPKFPRGLSLASLLFPFAFLRAYRTAFSILTEEKPDAVFSKGGYVSVPVVLAARRKKIPVILHESDSVASLSSRLIAKKSAAICTGFPDIVFPDSVKPEHTGNPVRAEIRKGSESAGQRITGFSGRRPVVMIIGGSQGSQALNEAVAKNLQSLVDIADIIHLTGAGKEISASHARYFSRPTVLEDLANLYALSDLVVSRSGAGVLSELAALGKPVITVPLAGVAHDHQVKNAELLASCGALEILDQKQLDELPKRVGGLLTDPARMQRLSQALAAAFPPEAAEKVAGVIQSFLIQE